MTCQDIISVQQNIFHLITFGQMSVLTTSKYIYIHIVISLQQLSHYSWFVVLFIDTVSTVKCEKSSVYKKDLNFENFTWHTEQVKHVGCQTRVGPAREAEIQMSPPTIGSPHWNINWLLWVLRDLKYQDNSRGLLNLH